MRNAAGLLVLAGGLLGIVAFFLPILEVHEGHTTISASAYQIARNAKQIDAPDQPRHEVDVDFGDLKGTVLTWFGHALLLAVIGVIVTARRRFGRVAGVFSLIIALLGICMAVMVLSLSGHHYGSALIVLIVSGVVGCIGGVIGIVKPTPREQPSAAVAPGIAA